jgi:ferredoxin
MLLAMMGIFFALFTSFLVTVNAFPTIYTQQHYRHLPKGSKSSRTSSSSTSSATLIYNTHPNRGTSASPTTGLETRCEQQDTISYPVQVIHQGRKTIINVHEDEPILQALERQSTIANGDQISLALSHIPHECRRGNCLTCASKIAKSTTSTTQQKNNLVVNVDNGLSPTVASELTKSGYVLTCCSYITGPGVVLELDQSNEVWDVVYKQRSCDSDTKQVALEAQARLLRRVDEENVEKWKSKMKKVWSEEK